MRINWAVFFENSSSQEALFEFSEHEFSLTKLKNSIQVLKVKREVDKLKKLGVKKARTLAKKALSRY